MAEQDKYGSHFGGKGLDPKYLPDKDSFHNTSGAEQDRYGSYFGGGINPKNLPDRSSFRGSSGAEQDRYGSHFRGIDAKDLPDASSFRGSSGAEQDRYGSWFGGKGVDSKNLPDKSSFQGSSGAEQDRYGSWFGGKGVDSKNLPDRSSFRGSSGAEQDRYGAYLGIDPKTLPDWSTFKSSIGASSGAEQDRYGSHLGIGNNSGKIPFLNTATVGILQSTILPSFGIHSGLSIIAYGASRFTNTVEGKDWLWPSGQVLNAWWSAVGIPVFYDGASISVAVESLTYTQKLLLGGVTAWGLHSFYRIASRRIARGKDDPRYDAVKKEPKFWDKAFFSIFLPEAVLQTLVTLPLTVPFRAPWSSAAASPNLSFSADLVHGLAVFLFTSGFALEVLAHSQLATDQESGSQRLNQKDAGSIVRHFNNLGDTLIHSSFPLLLAGAGMMHPVTLLGPVANYVFLRYAGGDRESEGRQEESYSKGASVKNENLQGNKGENNNLWTTLEEFQKTWTWNVVTLGVGGVVLERILRGYFKH